jgi:hypothetical protein
MIERKSEKEESISEISPWESLKEKENDSFTQDKDFVTDHVVTERTLYKNGTTTVTRTERWTLRKYLGHDEHVVIPDYITNIAYQAFRECKTIKTISIPPSVKSIGSDAFSFCENLESIYLSDPMPSITVDNVFGCKNLKTLYIQGKGEYTVSLENKQRWQSLECCIIGFKFKM